jgi:hypothetical protein
VHNTLSRPDAGKNKLSGKMLEIAAGEKSSFCVRAEDDDPNLLVCTAPRNSEMRFNQKGRSAPIHFLLGGSCKVRVFVFTAASYSSECNFRTS